MPIGLEYKSDHFVIRLVGSSFLTSLRRAVVVPYSDIKSVEIESPRWPSAIKEWRLGTHLPSWIAHGTFVAWKGGRRRFVHFERSTTRVLTLQLEGHPDFDEVSVEVRDPDAAQKELSNRAQR